MNVALYVRVSTEEQKQRGLSVDAQIERLNQWAKENGHVVSGLYNDAGISARKSALRRPALQQMLKDVASGSIQLIAFTRLDRYFRNVKEYYKAQDVLDKYKVPWVAVDEDYETQTSSGQFKVNIMLAVAQAEADRTSERIKSIVAYKKANGEIMSGRPPTGYKREKSRLVIDENTHEAVACFFERYIQTGEKMATADYILANYGLRLTYHRIYNMISSPIYYGESEFGPCPAYITKEQFDRMQEYKRSVVRKTKDNRCYIFSGMLYCSLCGKLYHGRHHHKEEYNRDYIYYSCCGRDTRNGCTNSSRIREDNLEKHLVENLELAIDDYFATSAISKKRRKTVDVTPQIEAQRKRIERLKDLYVDGLIGRDELKRKTEEAQAKIASLQMQQERPKQAPIIIQSMGGSQKWRDVYATLSDRGKREFWLNMLEKITISEDGTIGMPIR